MPNPPYALLSDHHCHQWSQFSTVSEAGINSRLRVILDEMQRAADELLKRDGKLMVFAGDLFHTRGAIDPEVFNPTYDTIRDILKAGVRIVAIPGNHDLKGEDTSELGNAMQSLGGLPGFRVVSAPHLFDDPVTRAWLGPQPLVMIPWVKSTATLLDQARALAAPDRDLVIHAPVNGVLNIPDHGLDPVQLAALGYNRVFSGHYHNHVDLGGGVYSIGATTHQTFSDIGTKAGFLLVHDDRVEFRASHAPKFVEVTPETEDVELHVEGNFVRVKLTGASEPEIKSIRDTLLGYGAAGVVVHAIKAPTAERPTEKAVAAGASLEVSVENFVSTTAAAEIVAELKARCQRILATAKEGAAA